MPAYVISEVEILDETRANTYRALASASIAQYGGRYIVRGGAVELLEGERNPARRLVIVEFPSLQKLSEWYDSPEYRPFRDLRQKCSLSNLVMTDGLS